MYHNVITVFNFHEKTGAWYTTVFKGVNLVEHKADVSTQDAGVTNTDTIEAIIRVKQDKSVHTIIYEPYRILDNEGNNIVSEDHSKLSYLDPDTDELRKYIGPKAYARLDNPVGYFTFKAEQDFIVEGNYSSDLPIDDGKYDEGLYHAMNDAQDGVYMITSAVFYSLLPHFEIGGR